MPVDLLVPGGFFFCLACLGMYLIIKPDARNQRVATLVGMLFVGFGGGLLMVICYPFLPAGSARIIALVLMGLVFLLFLLLGLLTLRKPREEAE